MKDKVLGNYTIRQSGNANSVTIPVGSGFKKGDNVILTLKSSGNLEIKKAALNFWDSAPSMSDQEKKEDLEDLGYNPLEQKALGIERIEN